MFFRLKQLVYPGLILVGVVVILCVRFHPRTKSTIRDFLSPFFRTERSAEWYGERRSLFFDAKVDLILKIEELETELDGRRIDDVRMQALEAENRALRAQLLAKPLRGYESVIAQVFGRDLAVGGRRLFVDRGSDDGVEIGQAVLARGVLLGRVVEVSRKTAHVLTIADRNCRVGVRISGTRCHGVLSGERDETWRTGPMCVVSYLPVDHGYEAGDTVETSAYSQVIPPGIMVGEVVGAASEEEREGAAVLYETLDVLPYAFVEDLSFVAIIVPQEDGTAGPHRPSGSEVGASQ